MFSMNVYHTFKSCFFGGMFVLSLNAGLAQSDTTYTRLDTINLTTKTVQFRNLNLYDIQEEPEKENIHGFTALSIFDNVYDRQVWVSPESQCVQLNLIKNDEPQQNSLIAKWDKITGGCKWIGMGFGWDNWKPKDMSQIVTDCAIEIKFKSPNTDLTNLPLAFAFEDYSGSQAFLGFNLKQLKSSGIKSNQWNSIILPLNEFPFEYTETDFSNIKQFVIQFEAEGELVIDQIKLIKKEDTQ